MPIGTTLRRYRVQYGISQETVGEATFCSQKAVSQIERGIRQPDPSFSRHLMNAIPNAIEFHAQSVFEEQSEFVSVPFLNCIDHHVQTALDVIISEYAEGIRAANMLKSILRNKLNSISLLPDARIEVMAQLGQIIDTYTANKVLLVAMAETYDINIDELEERHLRKLQDKGYWKPGK